MVRSTGSAMGRFYSVSQDEECSGLSEKAALSPTWEGKGVFLLDANFAQGRGRVKANVQTSSISPNVFYEGVDRKSIKSW